MFKRIKLKLNTIDINDKWKWIGIAFLFKLCFFVFFTLQFNTNFRDQNGKQHVQYGIAMYGHDTHGYVIPVENFMDGKGYTRNGLPDAFRMPGYITIYGPLYFMFGEKAGRILFILLQFLVGVLSVYYLARLAYLLSESKRVFLWTFFLYCISTFVSIYDHYLHSESFTASFVIFAFYFFVNYFKTRELNYLFYTSVFLAWANLFRPAVIFIVFCLSCYLLFDLLKSKTVYRLKIKIIALFALPFMFIMGIWTVRNYLVFHRFIPFIDALSTMSKSEKEILVFTKALGANWYLHDGVKGPFQYWFVPSEGDYFDGMTNYYDEKQSQSNPFKPQMFTTAYNIDSLRLMRSLCWRAILPNDSINESERKNLDTRAAEMAVRFRKAYIKEHFIDYAILNRVHWLKGFVFVSKSYALPVIQPTLRDKLIRRVYVAFYYFVLFSAFLSFVYFLVKGDSLQKLFVFIGVGFILFHLAVTYVENRYLVSVYPIFCIYTVLLWSKFYDRITNRNIKN